MVKVLETCGGELTRASVMKQGAKRDLSGDIISAEPGH